MTIASPSFGRFRIVVVAVASMLGIAGCHDLTGKQALPAGTQDPSYYDNAMGALGMRNTAIHEFETDLPNYIIATGLLTDEVTGESVLKGNNTGAMGLVLDARDLPELSYGSSGSYLSDVTYENLQTVRGVLLQAIGQLATYDTSAKDTVVLAPAAGRVLRGELYALYGYTEIMLADFFCSGIPLSTLDFQKNFTYKAGSTTAAVYQDAIAHLDTALMLSGDSARIQNLARVGLGRAYLDLGQFVAAADDVSSVPVVYAYQLSAQWRPPGITAIINDNLFNQYGVAADLEGENGLPYISSGDPRTADTTFVDSAATRRTVTFPKVYAAGLTTAYTPITVASGVEARLIQAEASLRSGGNWLGMLNDLRANAPIPGTTSPQPTLLPPLGDPGSDSARVALLFQERAAWLYMTGHRQGDVRRQLRQYPQYWPDESQLYPTGPYPGVIGVTFYGVDVTAPIPQDEYINPLFHGCVNRAP